MEREIRVLRCIQGKFLITRYTLWTKTIPQCILAMAKGVYFVTVLRSITSLKGGTQRAASDFYLGIYKTTIFLTLVYVYSVQNCVLGLL